MSARTPLRPAALLAITLLATACAPTPPERPELVPDTPGTWSAGREPELAPRAPGEAWWAAFGDARLDELIETVLAENRELAAAAARVRSAEAQARIAGADRVPSASLGPSAARRRQNFIGLPIPGQDGVLSSTSTNLGLSLDVSWEADLWGRIGAQAKSAAASAQAAAWEYEAARQSLAAQTAKTWFAIAETARQLDLAQRSAGSFEEIAEQVRARYERGVRPSIDLRLALSNAGGARATEHQARARLDALTRQLEILAGRYPAGDLAGAGADDPPPLALPPPVPAGLPADLIGRRPDLVAAERTLIAREQSQSAARAALYPRLSLTGSVGTSSDALGDLLDGDYRVWSLVGGLVQPLFQGGRLRAGVDRADADRRAAIESFASAALGAYGEVETALAAEAHLRRVVEARAGTAEQLEAARRLAEERYRNGVGSYLEMLESQTRSFDAERALLTARRSLIENRIDLHLALGGGFPVEQAPETR